MTTNPAFPSISEDKLEAYSSAITLSDMEIFVFPDLMYALVLANLMSPRIWQWRDDPWFAGLAKLTPYRRILRLKQYIMDHYAFNLDLETWGLTTQEKELARFEKWMPREVIGRSNALFGYEGDRFYFDLDIRRHFGLDKYAGDVIPYWKTETVESMDAFRYHPGHTRGAGECVSLSALYAAALYIVCGIPLESIYLIATPLHSQNFVDVSDGILTNNRRLVTKTMWFNGTELTAKARRALENEQVTIVAHAGGWVHTVKPEATMNPEAYARFKSRLQAFCTAPLSATLLFNFLRQNPARQKCFQIEHRCCGKPRWIPAEAAYAFEDSCPYKVSDATRGKLLDEMDEDDFFAAPMLDRIPLNKFDDFFKDHHIQLEDEADRAKLAREFNCYNTGACEIIEELRAFCQMAPHWPDAESPKQFITAPPLPVRDGMTREEIIAALQAVRGENPLADLAFYAYRDMEHTDWRPFIKAALERSPVCVEGTRTRDDAGVYAHLQTLPDASIYDGPRLAQPDEAWNAQRGDGVEKAILLATILHARHSALPLKLEITEAEALLTVGAAEYRFPTAKGFTPRTLELA